MLRKLVVIRHGDFNADGTLTGSGVNRLNRAARFLADRVEPPVRIASSVQQRARNSATIVIESLMPLGVEYLEELATGKDAPNERYARGDLTAVHQIVQRLSKDARTVVLVTHYEVCNYYPDFFLEKTLGGDFGCKPMKRGEAQVIDCATGHCTLLENDGFIVSWNGLTGDDLEKITFQDGPS